MKYSRQQFLKKSLSLWLRFLRGETPVGWKEEEASSFGSMAHDFHPYFHDQLKDALLDGEAPGSEAELLAAARVRMMEERPLPGADRTSGKVEKGEPRRGFESEKGEPERKESG